MFLLIKHIALKIYLEVPLDCCAPVGVTRRTICIMGWRTKVITVWTDHMNYTRHQSHQSATKSTCMNTTLHGKMCFLHNIVILSSPPGCNMTMTLSSGFKCINEYNTPRQVMYMLQRQQQPSNFWEVSTHWELSSSSVARQASAQPAHPGSNPHPR
jgi:hypothetical protein